MLILLRTIILQALVIVTFIVNITCLSAKTWANDNEVQNSQNYVLNASPVCSALHEMFDNKTIKGIVIGSPKENYKKSFFVDIDNDGDDEELQYFYSRTYTYVSELLGGKRFGLPGLNTSQGMGDYAGNSIVKFDGEFLQVHFGNSGILEIQRLKEKTPEEKLNNPNKAHWNYKAETICKNYED